PAGARDFRAGAKFLALFRRANYFRNHAMPIVDLIKVLQEFTGREKISIPASSAAVLELASYEPLAQYLNALAKDAKPERAAEDLFVSCLARHRGSQEYPTSFRR